MQLTKRMVENRVAMYQPPVYENPWCELCFDPNNYCCHHVSVECVVESTWLCWDLCFETLTGTLALNTMLILKHTLNNVFSSTKRSLFSTMTFQVEIFSHLKLSPHSTRDKVKEAKGVVQNSTIKDDVGHSFLLAVFLIKCPWWCWYNSPLYKECQTQSAKVLPSRATFYLRLQLIIAGLENS